MMKYLLLFIFCAFAFTVTMLCGFNLSRAKASIADAADFFYGRGDYAEVPGGAF
jgi:hypothetical protein